MGSLDRLKNISGYNMLHSFLHPEDAYQSAEDEANRGWNEAKGYQQPYWEHGNEQYGGLNEARQRLMNPADLENEWTKGYETSPYARQLLQQNQGAGLDAASSMGLNGSSAALANIQSGAGLIQNEDRRKYLQDLMDKYIHGIGLGQNLYNTGAQTGANLGQQAIGHGNDISSLEFNKRRAPGQLFGQALGAGLNYAAGGMPGLATGGASMLNKFNTGQPQY
jgi:hypothetical protein